jgi:hypothetical protein
MLTNHLLNRFSKSIYLNYKTIESAFQAFFINYKKKETTQLYAVLFLSDHLCFLLDCDLAGKYHKSKS